jgi:uncharacterized protein (DUF952 family)
VSVAHGPRVVLDGRLALGAAIQTAADMRAAAREAVEDLTAAGVIHAELRLVPADHVGPELPPDELTAAVHAGIDDAGAAGCDTRLIFGFGFAGAETEHPTAGRVLDMGRAHGPEPLWRAIDQGDRFRIADGSGLIDDCVVAHGRIVALGPVAAAVRDAGIPLGIRLGSAESHGAAVADHPARLLFDAGFRVTLDSDERADSVLGFSEVERAACVERAAAAAFLDDAAREALVARVFEGWSARPARLVHLAERGRWDAARGLGSYLPSEWGRDGFIHLSAVHQLLTPANRFYRGRDDLVALVVDAHLLGAAVVWEAGTGTVERFPHLYAALTPEAVLGEYPLHPEADGGFFLPPALVRAVRSPLGG